MSVGRFDSFLFQPRRQQMQYAVYHCLYIIALEGYYDVTVYFNVGGMNMERFYRAA
jgi:hypothetical protein